MKYRIRWKVGTVEGHGSWYFDREILDDLVVRFNRRDGEGTHWVEEERG